MAAFPDFTELSSRVLVVFLASIVTEGAHADRSYAGLTQGANLAYAVFSILLVGMPGTPYRLKNGQRNRSQNANGNSGSVASTAACQVVKRVTLASGYFSSNLWYAGTSHMASFISSSLVSCWRQSAQILRGRS